MTSLDHGPTQEQLQEHGQEHGHRPEQRQEQGRGRGPTLTLGICLAAGLAAGIGLLRPGPSAAPVDSSAAAQSAVVQAPVPDAGYGQQGSADQGGAAVDPAAPAAAAAVDILDFSFGTPPAVAPGSTITVNNRDGVAHTLTSNDGLFDTGSIDAGAATTVIAPQTPGTYSFFCAIHPSMQGSVTVSP